MVMIRIIITIMIVFLFIIFFKKLILFSPVFSGNFRKKKVSISMF